MSTKIIKWTREKGLANKADYRDATRRSHAHLPCKISRDENQRLQSLALGEATKKKAFLLEKDSLPPAIAVGCSRNANDTALRRRINKLRQETHNLPFLERKEPEILGVRIAKLKAKSLKKPPTKLETKLRRRESQLPLLLSDLTKSDESKDEDFSEDEKDQNDDQRNYLKKMKERINSFTEVKTKVIDAKKVNEIRIQQIEDKKRIKREAAMENALSDNDILKADLKAKREDEEKAKEKRLKQKSMREELDRMCAEKRNAKIHEAKMARKETKRIDFSTKMYEKLKHDQILEKEWAKQELLKMSMDDREARRKYLKDVQNKRKEEEERNFEYSVFKRAFGRKMRQHTRDVMGGLKSRAPKGEET